METEKSSIGVVGTDFLGYPYNVKYPPELAKYGDQYLGYKSWNREVFFYEFAVQGYDVQFEYHGIVYHLMADSDYYCTCPNHCFTPDADSQYFANGNDLIEHLLIEGKPLIIIIDELTNVEIM